MGTVRMPLPYSVISVIGILFFSVMLIFSAQEEPLIACIAGFFLLFMLWLLAASLNFRIDFDANGFTHRNYFRRSRRYSYQDVTAIRFNRTTIVYVGKKKISIEKDFTESGAFCHALKVHAHQAKRTESKLFGGNVENPEEFVFVFWFFYIGLLLMLLIAYVSSRDLKESELASVTAVVSGYEIETDADGDEDVLLYAQGFAEPFRVWYPEDMENPEQLRSEIQSGASFVLYYDKRKYQEEEVFTGGAVVQMLTSGTCTYLSLESTNRHNAEMRTFLLAAALIITALCFGFAALFNYITTNADRFPNAVRWFVKDSYIRKK